MSSGPLSPTIVLVRPQEQGNIGATARAMANMGLEHLRLVQPAASLGRVAYAFAVGAREILDHAVITDSLSLALEPFQRIIGTSSVRSREPTTQVLSPRELTETLSKEDGSTQSALVFGSEPSGLTNEELAHCGQVVQIPCSPRQPTLNLSQAVLILAWQLFQRRELPADAASNRPPAAPAEQVEGLMSQATGLLTAIGFARDDTFEGVSRELRQLSARAGLTAREVKLLRGICRRALHSLEDMSDRSPRNP
jgi:TrmH family RNA methyltransferase